MLRYAITHRTRFPGDESQRQEGLIRQAELLAEQDIDFLQLREKDMNAGDLAALARAIRAALRTHSSLTKLLINSRADIAVAVRADGVHLTSSRGELTPAQVRRLYAAAGLPAPVISVSCHTLSDVTRAVAQKDSVILTLSEAEGEGPASQHSKVNGLSSPTHILFGPVFEKAIASQPGIGLDLLHQACTLAAPIPVLALGGITESNASACLAAGAAGIAAIRLFLPISSL